MMVMVFNYTVEVSATLLEFYILFSLIELHSLPKYNRGKQSLVKAALCLGMTGVVTAMNQISLFSQVTIGLTILLVTFLGKLLCETSKVKSFIVTLLFCMMLNLQDFSLLSLINVILGGNSFFKSTNEAVGLTRSLWIIAMKVILFTLYLLYRKFVYPVVERQRNKSKYIKPVAVISVLCFFSVSFIVNSLFANDIDEIRRSIVPAWLFVIGCLIAVFLLFRALFENEMEKHDYDMMVMQSQYLESNYVALEEAQKANARNFHDFNHRLLHLQCLLEEGEVKEALTYIASMQKPLCELSQLRRCNVKIVDAVLNSKEQLAREKGIQVKIRAQYPLECGVENADICCILANLFDNAIEACEKIDDVQRRFLTFVCGYEENRLIIKMENSAPGNPFDQKGRLPTTKADKRMHGFGLKSVKSLVEKYDGTVNFRYENHVFCCILVLFF